MNSNSGAITRKGLFSIGSHHDLAGELFLQGPDSFLHIWTKDLLNLDFLQHQDITGILDNQEKVSLIKCIKIQEKRIGRLADSLMHYKFFPSYVTVGYNYLYNSDKTIEKISFTVDDAHVLFSNRNSFKILFLDSNQLKQLTCLENFYQLQSIQQDSKMIIIGSTSRPTIFSIDTVIGTISVHNCISTSQDQKEMSVKKELYIKIKFIDLLNIEEVYENIDKMLCFLEIISGRPQNLLEMKIITKNNNEENFRKLSLYLNRYTGRSRYNASIMIESPNPISDDILINASKEPDQFANLMSKWLERDKDEMWQIARRRFSDMWDKQRSYDPDRIVAAANMFDLLPKSAFGRIKHLKKKIKKRSQLIKDIINYNLLKDIDNITDQAVELRNFYVHGDKSADKSRKKLTKFTTFLTDTLEFIFCVSDLIELGWDFLSWYEKSRSLRHPLSTYIHHQYPSQSQEFLTYLEAIQNCFKE